MDLLSIFLVLSILAGQLIKLPVVGNLGPPLLDIFIFFLCIIGTFKLRFKFKNPPLFLKIGLAFILISIISLAFTPLHLTFFEIGISFSYTLRLLFYILLCWIIYSGCFITLKKNLISIFVYSGIGLSVLGLLQLIFLPNLFFLENGGWDPHYFRTVSTFFDPNFTGAYSTLTLVLLTFYFRGKNEIKPKIFFTIFTIVFLSLLTTFSRSSYLMFLVSGLLYAFLEKSKKLFFSTVILSFILLLGFQIYTQFVANPRGIDREESASSRFNSWEQGLNLFQKFPILGVGFNTYRYAIQEYNLGGKQFIQSHGSTSNDSSLLFVAATTGLLGFSIFLFFLLSIVKSSFPKKTFLIAAMGGILIHSFFSNSLFYPFIFVWIILAATS